MGSWGKRLVPEGPLPPVTPDPPKTTTRFRLPAPQPSAPQRSQPVRGSRVPRPPLRLRSDAAPTSGLRKLSSEPSPACFAQSLKAPFLNSWHLRRRHAIAASSGKLSGVLSGMRDLPLLFITHSSARSPPLHRACAPHQEPSALISLMPQNRPGGSCCPPPVRDGEAEA